MASFLQSVVGDSIARVKSDIRSIPGQVQAGVQGAVQNSINNTVSAVRGAANNAVNTGMNAAVQAAKEALGGSITGATDILLSAPQNILNNALDGFFEGKSSSSLSLSGALEVTGAESLMSSDNGIQGNNGLAGIRARSDPLMSYCWYCEMPQVQSFLVNQAAVNRGTPELEPTSLLAGAMNPIPYANTLSGSILGGSVNATEGSFVGLPWYYIESANLPFRTFGTRSIFREGRDRHYPDKYSVDNLAVVLYADSSNESLNYLQAWQSAMIRPFTAVNSTTQGGMFGRPADYKQLIRFYLLDVAKQQVAIVEYTECWPTNLDALAVNSDSSDRLTYHVNFSVGDVFVSTFDVSGSVVDTITNNPLSFPTTIQSAIGSVVNQGMQQAKSFVQDQLSDFFS